MTQSVTTLKELYQLAHSDTSFKQLLLSSPKEALSRVGVSLASEDAEVVVVEETAGNFYVVIPTAETAASMSDVDDPIAKLLARAASDEALRQEMLADPKSVITRETGIVIPEEEKVSVLVQTPKTNYLVLPRSVDVDEERELSSEELETVAGGRAPRWVQVVDKVIRSIYISWNNGIKHCLS
ncbi:MAG: NHLP leader peptide family RiPP precursor [Pseudanabaenaceae cyanobacterium SKYGB_i_bin29]|nr:NHLP leader peptide family RiPP precursor [Pseudanabaenaceae cyanobacterium SKYG29]MDW8421861.1 NHLP leader peptide family RiPP precursor [Pseudanabaenaceae cyanobacterium SKYGB_i_bin29]